MSELGWACRGRGYFGRGSHDRMLFFYITAVLFSKYCEECYRRTIHNFIKKVFYIKLYTGTFSLPSWELNQLHRQLRLRELNET